MRKYPTILTEMCRSIAGIGRLKPMGPVRDEAYVVLRQFTYPAGLYGADSATFFIPEGVPQPKGDPGHSNIYDFDKLKADKKASEELQDNREGLSEGQTKDGCEFAGLELPKNFAVFAAGTYSERKTGVQIDQSGQRGYPERCRRQLPLQTRRAHPGGLRTDNLEHQMDCRDKDCSRVCERGLPPGHCRSRCCRPCAEFHYGEQRSMRIFLCWRERK